MPTTGSSLFKATVRGLLLFSVCVSAQAQLKPIMAEEKPGPVVPRSELPQEMIKSPSVANAAPKQQIPQRLQALVKLHTAEELRSLLTRAEQIANGADEYSTRDPIALVLHGAEIAIFKRSNYRDNKELVDLAARLDAFNVVDLKVCRRWMGDNNLTEGDLPPFLEAVPFGGDEVQRLNGAGYAYF
ncbi:MAG: hypothetical protein MK185_15745 [Saccharospirillaceae bacterium]|nr:hypothetical protein [Saccharospirillaceae bacterium]